LGHVFSARVVVTKSEGKVDQGPLPAEYDPLERHGVAAKDSLDIG
jgi:hypothetical protein